MTQVQSLGHNRLLRMLSEEARRRLGPLERADLALRDNLEMAGTPIEFVYFLDTGLASVVAELPGLGEMEVGMIGAEGMTGLALVEYDKQSPFDTFIQGAGSAQRVEADRVRRAVEESPEIRKVFARFARSFTIQVAATAFANGNAKLEARLARWLLMVGDRMGDTFNITHEFLGMMLAVRRSGVTLAIQMLEGKGLIKATRGQVSIIDRAGLVAHANGIYGLPEREYQRLMSS